MKYSLFNEGCKQTLIRKYMKGNLFGSKYVTDNFGEECFVKCSDVYFDADVT